MRMFPLHYMLLLCITKETNGKRSVRGLQIKKGRDDVQAYNYYYEFARHGPKALKENPGLNSKPQSLSPPNQPNVVGTSATPVQSPGQTNQPTALLSTVSSSLPLSAPSDPSAPNKKKYQTSQFKKSKLTTKGTNAPSSTSKSMGKSKSKSKSKSKGKSSKGGGGGTVGPCSSPTANAIQAAIPDVTTRNPDSCCNVNGPVAVYVTHALPSGLTKSGFEPFWDQIYSQIEQTSNAVNVCFVMTGLSSTVDCNNSLDIVLIETNAFVSQLPNVAAMMSTDPTSNVTLIKEIRAISNNKLLPSIGVFNAGYNNIVIESILSGQGRLPYVGYLDDANYGAVAAQISLTLLKGAPATPLCFNGRVGELGYIGARCAAYYNDMTTVAIQPTEGVACRANETIALPDNVNAVWATVDCCSVVADAVDAAKAVSPGRTIVVGCQDTDTSGGRINFVTAQPIELQGYSAATWANFPVMQSAQGKDGRGEQYFPSLQSLVNTAIYNIIVNFLC